MTAPSQSHVNDHDFGLLLSKFDKIHIEMQRLNTNNSNNFNNIPSVIKNKINKYVDEVKSSLKTFVQQEFLKMELEWKEEVLNRKDNNVPLPNTDSYNSSNESVSKTPIFKVNPIIVEPLQQQDSNTTINQLKDNIDVAELGINITKLTNRPNGTIVIDVEAEADRTRLTNEIHDKLSSTLIVKKFNKKLPKVKIVKLDQTIMKLNDDKIVRDLCIQNQWNDLHDVSNNDDLVSVVTKYTTTNGLGSLILEVHPSLHDKIIKSGTVKFGWQKYRIYNHSNIIRCFRCWGFNNFADKCTKNEICRLCSGNHNERDCKSDEKKCINCSELNLKLTESNFNINHHATYISCSAYLRLVNKKQLNKLKDIDQ
ncbi:uncharacterized protein LOC141527762 [Cotesia typhae]|uniref:uncharacterized protein LOC141527762 n=1 Tax=Cotesia typhae TaxID=2053667 RepID=UPI003D68A45E